MALVELQDAEDVRRAKSERELRVDAEAVRLQEQLVAPQRQHDLEKRRSSSALTAANLGWGRGRRQRESADDYYRSYGGGTTIRSAEMHKPSSEAAWRLDGFQRGGHTPSEMIGYLSWCADFADWQASRRRQPGLVVQAPGP